MLRQLRFLQPTFDALGDDKRFETHVDDVFALKSNTYFFLLFVVRVCVSVCQEKEGPLQSRCLLDDHRKGVYRLRKGGYGGPFFFCSCRVIRLPLCRRRLWITAWPFGGSAMTSFCRCPFRPVHITRVKSKKESERRALTKR